MSKTQPALSKKSKFPNQEIGIEVPEGTNWITGLTHQQRCQKMLERENFWKKKYNANRSTIQSFSRG